MSENHNRPSNQLGPSPKQNPVATGVSPSTTAVIDPVQFSGDRLLPSSWSRCPIASLLCAVKLTSRLPSWLYRLSYKCHAVFCRDVVGAQLRKAADEIHHHPPD